MKISELPETFAGGFTYPVRLQTVVEEAGDIEIEAPDSEDSETVAALLEPLGDDVVESPELLVDTVLGNLGDAYIGRKFYDDRGNNPTAIVGPDDERDQSF